MNIIDIEKAAEKLAKKSRRTAGKPQSGTFDSSGRPVIQHDAGRLPVILNEIGAALALSKIDIFTRTGKIVRLYSSPALSRDGMSRPSGTLLLHPVDGGHLSEILGLAAKHEKFDARSDSYRPCDCPRRTADGYLSRGFWPELRPLEGFSEAPIITLANRLIERHGYDAETGLYLAFEKIDGYTSPPANPTKDDAINAAHRLLKTVAGFPFVAESDKSAFVAGVITCLLRRVLPAAPLFGITAPTAGTGKTLIAETFSIIASGRRASVLSLGHDDAETEKRLGGALMAGFGCVVIDNVALPLQGDLLCQVATQQVVQLRPLGTSAMVNVPTNSMLIATGNNLSVIGDLKRRVCMIQMDSCQERPEQRTFSNDHLEDVFSSRGEMIRDALTICLAYIAAGAPQLEGLYPMGGFGHWDRMVRRPLVWTGLPDPLKSSEGLREQDPDVEAMRLMFTAWQQSFKDKETTVSEVIAKYLPGGQSEDEELRDALQLICGEKPNSRRIGNWLKSHRDRIVDGLVLRRSGNDSHAKVARWCVQIACTAKNAGSAFNYDNDPLPL